MLQLVLLVDAAAGVVVDDDQCVVLPTTVRTNSASHYSTNATGFHCPLSGGTNTYSFCGNTTLKNSFCKLGLI